MPIRPGRWPQIDRGPLDEAVGQSILKHPLLRSAREQPEIAVPWIVLGLVTAGAYLYAGFPAALLVLLFGLPILFGARLLARRRPDRPSRVARPTDGFRLALMVAWVAAAFGVIAILAWLEAATGSTGIVMAVGCFVAIPILVKVLLAIFRV